MQFFFKWDSGKCPVRVVKYSVSGELLPKISHFSQAFKAGSNTVGKACAVTQELNFVYYFDLYVTRVVI